VTPGRHAEVAPPGSALPGCRPDEHCITCGDVAVGMRVLRIEPATHLAWCSEAAPAGRPGAAGEWVDTELVGDVRPGDIVLVHAGAALVLLDDPGGGGA
jgi:hydrogenase maturation factor